MPRYVADVRSELSEEEAMMIVERMPTLEHKAMASFLYLFGPRPSEVLELRARDFHVAKDEDGSIRIMVKIPTKKVVRKDNEKKFVIDWRVLNARVKPDSPVYPMGEYLYRWVKHIQSLGENARFWNYSYRTMHYYIQKASEEVGKRRTIYSFRHWRTTMVANESKSLMQIMSFKGARSWNAIKPYLHAIPVDLEY